MWKQQSAASDGSLSSRRIGPIHLFDTTVDCFAETAEDRARASSLLALGIAAVVGISVVVLIIILVIIDVSCYFVNSCGVTMIICTRVCGKSAALGKEKTAEEGERYDSVGSQYRPATLSVSYIGPATFNPLTPTVSKWVVQL